MIKYSELLVTVMLSTDIMNTQIDYKKYFDKIENIIRNSDQTTRKNLLPLLMKKSLIIEQSIGIEKESRDVYFYMMLFISILAVSKFTLEKLIVPVITFLIISFMLGKYLAVSKINEIILKNNLRRINNCIDNLKKYL